MLTPLTAASASAAQSSARPSVASPSPPPSSSKALSATSTAHDEMSAASCSDGSGGSPMSVKLYEPSEREELAAAAAHSADEVGVAVMEPPWAGDATDDPDEGSDLAQRLAYGWPSRDDEPTRAREAGRLSEAFPLVLPMGIGDLYDSRSRPVSAPEHAQHLLRLPWIW